MSPVQMAAVIALTTAGATVHGSIGIGFGLVAGPALVAIDPGFAPGPLLLMGQAVGLRHILVERGEADRPALTNCLVGLPFGLLVGLLVLVWVDDRTLGMLVGGVTAAAAIGLLVGGFSLRRTRPVEMAAGAASALTAVTAGMPGPPLVIAFSDMRPAMLRATSSMFFIVVAALGLIGMVVTGNFGGRELELLVVMIPGVLAGLIVARFVRPHVERVWFRPLVLVVAMLGGLVLLGRNM